MHGCGIYYVSSFNNTWNPPSDIIFRGLELYTMDDYVYKYATAIYYSLRVFTIHDVGPTAVIERMMFAIFAVVSAMVNAYIFGNIYVLIGEMNEKPNQFQEEQDAAATAMSNLKVPTALQLTIKEYMLYTFSTKDTPQQLQVFLERIPDSFVMKVQHHVLTQILAKNIHLN
jgi:hypothetical protein